MLESQAMWAVFALQAKVLHHAHNVNRGLQKQLDRQNYITYKDTADKL